ncbi:MAG: VapC toxin family PIN domain ribonuclease [Chloroflexi bacterium HGW-Chloroflexi-5]|jgi:tRNA(fMet)-specific endonuclease VapC|nr:MAG: VapC toxin family PIN domain ribonuclease [Deltaproteobacteria bacterium HGW-Deltaproteobacteria-12]PKN96749.1 MAG: VapC toxin family PIN domain ribonuclease [Chloroflexi bacterium HGW-Chloroflexi-5]
MRYLLDTNICIYLIKKHSPEILKRLREHSPQDIAISTITLFELQYGVEKSHYKQRSDEALNKFLLPLNIIDVDRSAALEAAVIRAQLEKKGISIGPYDLLIAGLARSQDMTLVTNNTKEFKRVVNLHLEDWSKP